MAKYFEKRGIASAAIHSQNTEDQHSYDRHSAVEAFVQGNLKVLFVVDIFNEGVDIPEIDTVMFLRPTESYVVFLQQLGRGLRKSPSKDCLTVIDFIGNYKRAHYIPLLLAGENPMDSFQRYRKAQDLDYPERCVIHFDFRIIDLFEELAQRDPLPQRLKDTYYQIRDRLGRRPTRLDIYEGSDIPIREYLKNGWLRFLESVSDLREHEEDWLDTAVEGFLKEVEGTRFSKAYKIPTILSFLKDGTIVKGVTLDEIGENMMRFYHDNPIHQKDLSAKNVRNWHQWDHKEWAKLARKNPVNFLCKGAFFHFDEINDHMYLDDSLKAYLTPNLASQIHDILKYRRIDYFRKRF